MAEMILYFKTPIGLGTTIHADFLHKTIQIENHTDRILDTAFGVNTTPTWKDFETFLEDRCFPRTRDKLKLVLEDVGVDHYDPLLIIRKTHGRMAEDHAWIDIEESEQENEHTIDRDDR